MSIHVELPSTVDTTLDTEITVHNPDSNEDVLLSKSQPFRLPLTVETPCTKRDHICINLILTVMGYDIDSYLIFIFYLTIFDVH